MVSNNWILETNQKFIQRQKFYGTQKFALFWPFFGQKWTQKGQEHNFLALRDFLLMSQVILEEARNHSSISLKTFCMIFITKHCSSKN